MPTFNSCEFQCTLPNEHIIMTDACQQGGGAIINANDWLYIDWQLDFPDVYPHHINVKETLTAILAIYRCLPSGTAR